jgi:hypothetical protein
VNVEEAGRLRENGNGSGNGGGHDRAHLVHHGARVLLRQVRLVARAQVTGDW